LVNGRGPGYANIHSLLDAGMGLAALERLADADAFHSIGMQRREVQWEVSALKDRPIGVFEGQPSESDSESQIVLPLTSKGEHVVEDYASIVLSVKAHPVSLVREKLRMLNVRSSEELKNISDGATVKVTGLVIVPSAREPRTGSVSYH
jgi:error-prone DNA polymerase